MFEQRFFRRPDPRETRRVKKFSIPLYSCSCESRLEGVILSRKPEEVVCHYVRRQHVPCTLHLGHCPCQERCMKCIELGYVAFLPLGGVKQGICIISPSMLDYCNELRECNTWRGAVVEMWKKEKENPQSHKCMKLSYWMPPGKELPQALDVARWLSESYFARFGARDQNEKDGAA